MIQIPNSSGREVWIFLQLFDGLNFGQAGQSDSLLLGQTGLLTPVRLGWGGGIRTPECLLQRQVPYHLATPQCCSDCIGL